jgi:hypothetical protein
MSILTNLDVAIELLYKKPVDKQKARIAGGKHPIFRRHLISLAKRRISNALNLVYQHPNNRLRVEQSIYIHPIAARHVVTFSKRYKSPTNPVISVSNNFKSPGNKKRKRNSS